MSEWKDWENASRKVRQEGIIILVADKFHFKIIGNMHPQVDDVHYVVSNIGWLDYMLKLKNLSK